jgi:hypothetical protein
VRATSFVAVGSHQTCHKARDNLDAPRHSLATLHPRSLGADAAHPYFSFSLLLGRHQYTARKASVRAACIMDTSTQPSCVLVSLQVPTYLRAQMRLPPRSGRGGDALRLNRVLSPCPSAGLVGGPTPEANFIHFFTTAHTCGARTQSPPPAPPSTTPTPHGWTTSTLMPFTARGCTHR